MLGCDCFSSISLCCPTLPTQAFNTINPGHRVIDWPVNFISSIIRPLCPIWCSVILQTILVVCEPDQAPPFSTTHQHHRVRYKSLSKQNHRNLVLEEGVIFFLVATCGRWSLANTKCCIFNLMSASYVITVLAINQCSQIMFPSKFKVGFYYNPNPRVPLTRASSSIACT